MPLEMTTTDQAALLHGVKFCVHSRAGAGKTWLNRTLHLNPATGPLLLLSAESGILSLADVSIPQITISSFQDMEEAYNYVAYWHDHVHPSGIRFGDFRSVSLDSISEIAEQCLIYQKGVKKDGRAAYGEMGDEMRKWIRLFRDLPGRHVYFSAKQGYHKDDVTGVSRYGPSMPGQALTQSMPYFFDELFCLEVHSDPQKGQEFRALRTGLGLQHECKDRSGALDPFEPPDLGHIVTKIQARNLALAQTQPAGLIPPTTGV